MPLDKALLMSAKVLDGVAMKKSLIGSGVPRPGLVIDQLVPEEFVCTDGENIQ